MWARLHWPDCTGKHLTRVVSQGDPHTPWGANYHASQMRQLIKCGVGVSSWVTWSAHSLNCEPLYCLVWKKCVWNSRSKLQGFKIFCKVRCWSAFSRYRLHFFFHLHFLSTQSLLGFILDALYEGLHLNFHKIPVSRHYYYPHFAWGNHSTERFLNLPKGTLVMSSYTGIQIQSGALEIYLYLTISSLEDTSHIDRW